MNDTTSKLASFVDSVYEKTTERKLPWREGFDEDTFEALLDGFTVRLSRAEDFEGDEVPTLFLLNPIGKVLEQINGGHLRQLTPNVGLGNYYSVINAIFQMAFRQATGADEALDEALARLKRL